MKTASFFEVTALMRNVSARFVDVPLIDALNEIAAEGRLLLIYSPELIPADQRLTITLRDTPPIEAIRRSLAGQPVRMFSSRNMVVLVGDERRQPAARVKKRPLTGVVTGQVTDAATGAALPSASVVIEGTDLGTLTNAAGRFRIGAVPPGEYTITASRIGYAESRESVQVVTGQTTEANFSLELQPTALDEVVVTATGELERRAIGNVVDQIEADSLVKFQTIPSVQSLISGRSPGVHIIQGPGMVGSGPIIRIRGVNSLSLRNDPLVIVDGIRVATGLVTYSNVSSLGSRLSSLNENEIASIDVIKGPAAAALYGTAAANGVLVITTRRGRSAGNETTWRAYMEFGLLEQRADWEANYWSWGHNIDPVTGQPFGGTVQCRIQNASAGLCMVDSLTSFSPLEHPETTPFSAQPRYQYGLQASGGSGIFNYFVAGEFDKTMGPYEMPASEIERLTNERGTAPRENQIHPNASKQVSLRGNFDVDVADNARLSISTGYIDRTVRNHFDGSYLQGLTLQTVTAPGYRTAADGNVFQRTGDIFSVLGQYEEKRFTGSMTAVYNPRSWLTLRGTAGLDQTSAFAFTLQRAGEGVFTGWGNLVGRNGGKSERRETAYRYSLDLGGTATWNYRPTLSFRTSVGAQYFRHLKESTFGDGFDLLPGATTLTSAGRRTIGEATEENATYGAFIEEMVSWRDRLFLTGSVRTDKNSAFGINQGTVLYPRVSLSWVISEEPFFPELDFLDDLRLRSAWGKAGVQPTTTAALAYYSGELVPSGGVLLPALSLTALGNPDLRPEITTEFEFGGDLALFDNRFTLEATYFDKQSKDALIEVDLPPSPSAGGEQFQNLGAVRNSGFELGITVEPIRTSNFSWSIAMNGSKVENEVLDLGGIPIVTRQGARNVEGYPIMGLWARPILGWDDADGDGILIPSEIQVGDSLAFIGPQIPTKQASLTNNLSILGGAIYFVTQFDYRGGHYSQWNMGYTRCVGALNCRAVNDPDAPLEAQAAAVAASTSAYGRTKWGYFRAKDYVRLREAALTFSAPQSIARMLRVNDASITLAGRNLAILWTDYPGIDPEASYTLPGYGNVFNYDWFSPPPLRRWVARVNLTL